MEQQRALNALEPYLALSKSATSARAAADLIAQATAAPQTYVFAELLRTPNIQALRNSQEYLPHLRLLEIFAWGTLSDYSEASNLPSLSQAQQQKLQLLSLLPLCSQPTTLNYSTLHTQLFPNSPPDDLQLETLVTRAIYASLINAHLDPLNRVVRVTSTAPLRDLSPNSIPNMIATLEEWEGRCNNTLGGIEAQIADIRAKARNEKARSRRRLQEFEEMVAHSSEQASRRGASKGGDSTNDIRSNGGQNSNPTGSTNAFGMMSGLGNKLFGMGGGRGGKRAAGGFPADEDDEDIMEVDDELAQGRGGLPRRGAKRQGRSGGLR